MSAAIAEVNRLFAPPPAPYVTLIKSGFCVIISETALSTTENLSSVFGGKTSKDRVVSYLFKISEIFIISSVSGTLKIILSLIKRFCK